MGSEGAKHHVRVSRSTIEARNGLLRELIEQARRLQQLLEAQAATLFDKTDATTPNASKYPKAALYEAMGNALAHRDYELVDPTRFTAFADRIEFLSPGSLPHGITLDALRSGKAAPRWRNQALAWFFSRLQLAQAEGQGVSTIVRTMREEGCHLPASKRMMHALPAYCRRTLAMKLLQ